MATWEIFDGKEVHGPFAEDALANSIRGGLPASVMVRRVGDAEWTSMRAHAPFAYALSQASAAVPTAPAPPPAVQTVVVESSWSGCLSSCGTVILFGLFVFAGIVLILIFTR